MTQIAANKPIRVLVTVPNPEDIHPELMRDDIGDALSAAGFTDIALDVLPDPDPAGETPDD